jgi:hypothetical protein
MKGGRFWPAPEVSKCANSFQRLNSTLYMGPILKISRAGDCMLVS